MGQIRNLLQQITVLPDEINGYLQSISSSPSELKTKLLQLLTRPNVKIADLGLFHSSLNEKLQAFDLEIMESAEIQIKYEGYIKKEQELVEKMSRLEHVKLPADFDYQGIPALSNEAKNKLSKIKPLSIGQASRISGVSPSDISILLVYMGR